jgi:hypothetical protein
LWTSSNPPKDNNLHGFLCNLLYPHPATSPSTIFWYNIKLFS